MSPTFRVGELKLSLIGKVCSTPDTRLGNEGPAANSSGSTFEASVRRLFRAGVSEFATIWWETEKSKSIKI